MVGIEEVARHADVSTSTVSRALSGNGYVSPQARLRVQTSAQTLGYVVSSTASSLASGRMKNIGVVVPFLHQWFYANVVEGAQQQLLSNGYDLTLYNLAGGEEQRQRVFEHFLLRQRVDAVIAVSLELTENEVTRLRSLGKPLVGVGGAIAGVHTLTVDDVAAARLATDHLIELGHTRIAHIGGSKDFDRDFHLPTNRRRGYEAALDRAGLRVESAFFQPANFTLQGGYQAARHLLLPCPASRPTAIFAASDEMAIGSILAARDLGLSVPNDVSVIGIDDHEDATFFGLSTVAQFPHAQGREAVNILLRQLSTQKPVENGINTDMPVELRARSSTARPHS